MLTISRIIGAVLLLFIKPLSAAFYVCYALCGLSDIFDGYLARKTNTASKTGEISDSIADFIMIAALFVIMLPVFPWRAWMVIWIIIIAFLRFAAWFIGFLKFHEFSSLHTYLNKVTGFALFAFPVFYHIFGAAVTVTIICAAASLSAVEELAVIIVSKKLNRNVKGIFYI